MTTRMKRLVIPILALGLGLPAAAVPQTATPPPGGQKSLSATVGVYVFPTAGQPPEQQNKDEGECYTWAVGQTGSDPFQVQKQAEQAPKEAPKKGKTTGKGALGGAAAGALIGEIASDDAGKGAAIGAATGALAGHHKASKTQKKAGAEAETQAQQAGQATAEQLEGFKKAFSVCLEAKQYMVKF